MKETQQPSKPLVDSAELSEETEHFNPTMEEMSAADIRIFLELHQIKNEQGTVLDFKDHAFLWDIYGDFAPKQVILKAAQIGFSTLAIIKSLWTAKYKGIDLIYTLPTADDVNDFVSGKVNRIVSQNPIFQEFVKDKDSIEQKRVGDHVVYYRGTWTQKAALMITSDLNIHDEEDRSKQDIISQYASRLQHSSKRWQWHFSNPSVMGNGVSKYWDKSTQHHWFIQCGECNEEQYLEWPRSIDPMRKCYQCKHCAAELTNEHRRKGRWVARYKDREYKGYWISLLMAPWTTAQEILDLYETKSKEYFWNFVLGLPYIGEGNTIIPSIFTRNCTYDVNSQTEVVIGVDSGIEKHFVCGNKEGIFYVGKTTDWADIASMLKKWPRSIAVIDHLPDITGPRKLREEFPGRVFLCHYARDRKTMQYIRWGKREEVGNVVADRNRMIQSVIDEFADGRIALQGNAEDWQEYIAHWLTLYRLVEVDGLGVPQFTWNSNNGIDHFAHATVYWRVGMSKYGGGKAEIVGVSPKLPEIRSPEISAVNTVPVPAWIMPKKDVDKSDWRNS